MKLNVAYYSEILNNKKTEGLITDERYAKYISKLYEWQLNDRFIRR